MSALKNKSELFADRIVKLHTYLTTNKKEFVISKQIVRSGTSIGANIAEASFSGSDKDFLCKLNIAAKECSETGYWLNRLKSADYISKEQFDSVYKDWEEIGKMLTSSIKTKKKNMHKL
jgi:four helix bundle protein